MMTAIKLINHKYSIFTSNNTLPRGKQSSESGSYLIERRFGCALFPLTNSKMFFSTSTPHFQTFLCDITT
ncbi:hypothetical protein E2C01_028153 [Portunus trituberculatus]|uniref:Uncharacterized protein n=1 Tax=Portunus trituberculatus TaxID=210409 RepID=A0A5B7EKL1_PORTR|nr:hypothetical protein [Portunus trituberculatus]